MSEDRVPALEAEIRALREKNRKLQECVSQMRSTMLHTIELLEGNGKYDLARSVRLDLEDVDKRLAVLKGGN